MEKTNNQSVLGNLLAVVFVVWLLFFGGFSTITKLLSPSTIAPIAKTIGEGARRINDQAGAAAPLAPLATLPASTKLRLPVAPARGAGVSAGQPSAAPTIAATAQPTALIVAQAPAVPAAAGLSVPEGVHTDINPDGSFTIDGGATRYYPDTNGVIVDVRLKGSEDYLQNVPTDAPTPTIAYVAPTRLPNLPACRHGCPKP